MADIAKIKRNISKMIDMDAPEADIDAYLAEEGVTPETLKGQAVEPEPTMPQSSLPTRPPDPNFDPSVGAKTIGNVAGSVVTGMAESVGRTLSGFQNTQEGFKETQRKMAEPETEEPSLNDRMVYAANLLTNPLTADPRVAPTVMGAAEDVGNITLVAGLVRAGYAGLKALTTPIQKMFPGLSDDAAKKVAGEVIAAQKSTDPIFVKNAQEAAELQKKFPDLKFTVGQSTGNPKALATEKALVSTTESGKMAKAMQQVQADDAIKGRLDDAFPGSAGPEDVQAAIKTQQKGLERETAVSGALKKRSQKILEAAQQPEDAGAALSSKAREAKAATKETVRKMFGKVDTSIELPSQELSKTVDDIAKQPFGKKPEDYPSDIMNFIKEKTKPQADDVTVPDFLKKPKESKPLTFGDTIEIRSQITDAIRAEKGKGPLGNDTLIKRLEQLRAGTEKTQEQGLRAVNPQAYKDYLEAKKFYATDYVPRFKQGATSEVLRKTGTGDKYIDDAKVGAEYFKPGNDGIRAAQDFQKTFGNDVTAKMAIRDYAAQDMLRASRDELTGEISNTKLMAWINRHRPALSKYGLWNEFRDINTASRRLVKAQAEEAAFNKSYASKVLGVDAQNAVGNLFSGAGKKDSAAAAQEIMGRLKGDKKAIQGMQNATKDYIMEKIQSTTKDAANNPLLRGGTMEKWMKDLDPALAVIYRDNPSKLTALKEVRQTLDILRRSNTNLTGGSETAMFASEALHKGFGALGGKWSNFFLGWAKRASDREMEKVLVNAYFNPEVAADLMNAVNKKAPPSVFFESVKTIGATRAAQEATEEEGGQ